MKIINLSENEFKKFYQDYEEMNFLQTIEIGNLKKALNNEVHYVALVDKDKILAATMLIASRTIFNIKSFYAPRGPLLDYNNSELISTFTSLLKKYIKKHHGFRLIIDRNIIYQKRANDGSILENVKANDHLIANLENAGFKHFGFNNYFETMQVRFASLLDLVDDYETSFEKFSKSTKKNIQSSYDKGLRVKKGTKEDLKTMSHLFSETANRKEYKVFDLDYYYQMYEHAHDLMNIYLAHLDPKIYLESTKEHLKSLKDTKKELLAKAKLNQNSKKIEEQIRINEKQIKKQEGELELAIQFKKDYPKGRYVAGLLSIRSGNEHLTLTSGALEEYFRFTPKYLLYSQHIKDAYQEKFKYANFYGISGNFQKENNPLYGIFEFKRGFNSYVIEYIGQFTLEVTYFNKVYNLLKKIKK